MPKPDDNRIEQAFHVPLALHLFSGFVHKCSRLWIWLGHLESWVLREKLQGVDIDRPIYVAGLARAGSTILLEFLATHPDVVTHQYRDFPPVFTPYWWQQAQQWGGKSSDSPVPRAHLDRLMVTPDSPEAMEEGLWMAFFADAHNPQASQVLDRESSHSEFERFYRDHIRKLLFARGGRRYVSKGNYNVTRLEYLLKLFPDARFVIPVRRPLNHIASSMKQHRLFTEGETRHPRALAYMRRVGHYEFGLDRRPINTGDRELTQQVSELWQRGEEVRGWARYWASIYGWLADRLDQDQTLGAHSLVVRFEDLCTDPQPMLQRILAHCGLEEDELASSFAERVEAPTYYRPEFSQQEEEIVLEETRSAAERYGYVGAEVVPADLP